MWFHLHEWYILDMAPSLDASGVTREGLGWNPRSKTKSGQFITTSAKVTPNGGLVREFPPKWP